MPMHDDTVHPAREPIDLLEEMINNGTMPEKYRGMAEMFIKRSAEDDGRPYAYYGTERNDQRMLVLVFQNEAGFRPLTLFPGTLEECEEEADRLNLDMLGLTSTQANLIIASSMTAQRKEEEAKQLRDLSRAVHKFAAEYREDATGDETMELLAEMEAHTIDADRLDMDDSEE